MAEEKIKLCKYCGENKAVKTIFNPNTWDDGSEDLWQVCATCSEVIDNQMKLSMGSIIASRPLGKEIGEKMKAEAIKRLKEISYEADVPIISVEFQKENLKEKK
jgi:hypothetical protein